MHADTRPQDDAGRHDRRRADSFSRLERPATITPSDTLRAEVLCQFQSLRLVARTDGLAIKPCRPGEHSFVDDDLTMIENERHLSRTLLKHGTCTATTGTCIAEAGIKKSRLTVRSRCSPGVWVGGLPIIGLNPLKQAILLAAAVSLSLHGWPQTPRRGAETA